MYNEENSSHSSISCFRDTGGSQPLYAVVCENEFQLSKKVKYCLSACKSHYDYRSGYVSLYCDNPSKKIRQTNENYIYAIVVDPQTILSAIGDQRFAISSRLEKEGRNQLSQWNKIYGPNGKSPGSFGLPSSVLFKVSPETKVERLSAKL